MVSLKEKQINGKKYLYAEYSFRLPDNKIKKLSKLIKSKEDINTGKVKAYFLEKEAEEYKKSALKRYKPDLVLTQPKIEQIESMRIEYKQIIKNLSKKQFKDVLDRFTTNFTYESNAIEGNSLTLKDVTMVLHENIMPKGKDLREVYETKNTRIANDLLFNNKIKITIKGIINIHKVLVKDTDVSFGFKKFPNFLLMRNVKTTPPERVEESMGELIEWYELNKEKMHPLKIAAEFHARFERIHPFDDGNGRVGRILINATLLENDYPPIIIRKMMRQSYFSSLEAYDNGYKHKFERFLLEKMGDTFEKFFKVYVKYL